MSKHWLHSGGGGGDYYGGACGGDFLISGGRGSSFISSSRGSVITNAQGINTGSGAVSIAIIGCLKRSNCCNADLGNRIRGVPFSCHAYAQ